MKLVEAKCPNCSAILKFDRNKGIAICDHCGSSYFMEDEEPAAPSVPYPVPQGPSIENLIQRGLEFEEEGFLEKAAKYYNDVLDIDCNNAEARDGLERIQIAFDNEAIYSVPVVEYNRDRGKAILTRKYLKIKGRKADYIFTLSHMHDVCAKENYNYWGTGGLGRPVPNCLLFHYEKSPKKHWVYCKGGKARELAEAINNLL